ncbi:MAG: hypothetical protein MUD16_06305 [Desulfobacterales bacterium]|nr:hypothetical protein [Desulfobacterales bacterium]
MKLAEIVRVLEATVLLGEDGLATEITRCGASDLMSDVLARPTEGILLLTGLTSVQTVRTSKIAGVVAIVFVRGKVPLPEVIEVAKNERMPIFSTPFGMFACCGRLHALGLTGLDGRR